MPVGFEAIGESGSVLIGSDWSNYALANKQVIVSSRAQWISPAAGSVYTSNDLNEIVFASASVSYAPTSIDFFEGQRRFRVGTLVEGVPVTFYAFKKQPPTNATFGLQLFDENGVLTFNSTDKMCRISGNLPISLSTQPRQFTFGVNRQYAILASSFTGQLITRTEGGGLQGWRYLTTISPMFTLNSSGVSFDRFAGISEMQFPIPNPTPDIQITNIQGQPYLVADVTDY